MKNPFVAEAIKATATRQPDIEVKLSKQFAQCAEDLIGASLLRALSEKKGFDLSKKRYLEIGANHPIATSATYLLNIQYGMRGVLVEANPALHEELKRVRPDDIVLSAAVHASDEPSVDLAISNHSELSSLSRAFVENWRGGEVGIRQIQRVPAIRINDLLKEHFPLEAPIFFSIDVEGLDLDVLRDVDWSRWRPAIVQAEPSNHFLENNDVAIRDFMESQNYLLIAQTEVNQIYIDASAATALTDENSSTSQLSTTKQQAMPSVGIVTRTKDRNVLLRRALESVKQQTYKNWQLVVVNDAGEQEPVQWLVENVFGDDPRVSIVHRTQSSGMEAASNAGLEKLTTDYAVIHDDDDSWSPEFLSMMIGTMLRKQKSHPSIQGVTCRVVNIYERVIGQEIVVDDVVPYKSHFSYQIEEGFLSLAKMLVRNQFPPIAFIFNLNYARELKLFDESLPVLGDWDFHLKFLSKHDVWVLPESLAFYHYRTSVTGAMDNSVHAGIREHKLYSEKIRNIHLRAALGGDRSLQASLVISAETQEMVRDETNHILWRLGNIEAENRQLFVDLKRSMRPGWRKFASQAMRRVRRSLSRLKGK